MSMDQYVYKQRSRHKFHILMTVITCGIWGVTVWPAMIAWNYFRSGRKSVTRVEQSATLAEEREMHRTGRCWRVD